MRYAKRYYALILFMLSIVLCSCNQVSLPVVPELDVDSALTEESGDISSESEIQSNDESLQDSFETDEESSSIANTDENSTDDEELAEQEQNNNLSDEQKEEAVDESEQEASTDPYAVAEYIHINGKLPENYITKEEAKKLGWNSSEGNLWDVADGKSIGGDHFGNYEELLPVQKGRQYKECDVNYHGGYRGKERLVFSNDGLIYYTDDHYKSFTQLY